MSRHLFSCPTCGHVGATSDYDLEWFDEPELEDIQTEFDEETYSEAPEAQPRVVDGDIVQREDGQSVKVNNGIGNRSSGIVTETVVSGHAGNAKPATSYRKHNGLTPLDEHATVKATRPPKRGGAPAREGFESLGDDPSQDIYEGLGGKDLHFEQMLQAAYESDLRDHGFSSESTFI